MHTQTAQTTRKPFSDESRTNIIDARWDEMEEAERIGILKALFGRAESLKPMMLR